MQRRSWLIASVLIICLGGALCSRNQVSDSRNGVDSRSGNTDRTSRSGNTDSTLRSGNTDSPSTIRKSQNNNTSLSRMYHVVSIQTLTRDTIKHTSSQGEAGSYTTRGLNISLSARDKLGHVASIATPVVDTRLTERGVDLVKEILQREDSTSHAPGSEGVISPIYTSEGSLSQASESNGFTPQSSISEGSTSLLPISEDLKSLSRGGKHFTTQISSGDFVSSIFGGEKIKSPPHESEKFISRTTGSERLKQRKQPATDFVNKVQGDEEWGDSMLNDEIKDEGLSEAQNSTKKIAQNSKQEVHKGKFIEQTASENDDQHEPVQGRNGDDVRERLKATVPQRDNVTSWESDEEITDKIDDHFTTGMIHTAKVTELNAYTEQQRGSLLTTTPYDGSLLNTVQQSDGSVPPTQRNVGFINTVQGNKDMGYTVSNVTARKNTLYTNQTSGRWKQHGEVLIDIPSMTPEEYVHRTQAYLQTEHTAPPVGYFMDTRIQSRDHTGTTLHAKLPQTVHKQGHVVSNKQIEEETRFVRQTNQDVPTQESKEITHRTSKQTNKQQNQHGSDLATSEQTNKPTHNQHASNLATSKTNNYLIHEMQYKPTPFPVRLDGADTHTAVADRNKVGGTTKVSTSFHTGQLSDELKNKTQSNTEMGHTADQHKRRAQQTNGDSSDYTTHHNNVEERELPNVDFMRKNNKLNTTQAIQNGDMAHAKQDTEKVTDPMKSGVFDTNNDEYHWKTRDKLNGPSNYSVAEEIPDYDTETTYGKYWTSETGRNAKSRNSDITTVQEETNETTRATTFSGHTSKLGSITENNISQPKSRKEVKLATSATALTGSVESDTSSVGNEVATATLPQDNVFRPTPTTPDRASVIPKLPNRGFIPSEKDKAGKTTQLPIDNVTITTAISRAREAAVAAVTNDTELFSSSPALKGNDEMGDNIMYSTQTRADNADIFPNKNDTAYIADLGLREGPVTVGMTTNMKATSRLQGIDCVSGLGDVSCSTPPTVGDGVSYKHLAIDVDVAKKVTEFEGDKYKTFAATKSGVVYSARTEIDQVLNTTPLASEYRYNTAADFKPTGDDYTSEVEDKRDDISLSEDDYVSHVSPTVQGGESNTPIISTDLVTTSPASRDSVTSNRVEHPQTETSLPKAGSDSKTHIKNNQSMEQLKGDYSSHQGRESLSQKSAADVMEVDEPDTSLASTLLTDLRSAEENVSEPRKEFTKPYIDSMNTQSKAQDTQSKTQDPQSKTQDPQSTTQDSQSPKKVTPRPVLVDSDSKYKNTEPGMFSLPSGYLDQESRSTFHWGKTTTGHENQTHKPGANQTNRHASEATQTTNAQGSYQQHSHVQEINASVADRETSTNREPRAENKEIATDHTDRDAHLTDKTLSDKNDQEFSVGDSYLTSQKSLLRNTKTLPEFNTETMNSVQKTTETSSEIFNQETSEETGEASNPLVTSSQSSLEESSYCPSCRGPSTSLEFKDTQSRTHMSLDPSLEVPMSSAGSSNGWSSLGLSPSTTSFSSTSSKESTWTLTSNNADKQTHATSPRQINTSNQPGVLTPTSASIANLDQITPPSTYVVHKPSADKLSSTTTSPTLTTASPTSKNSSGNTPPTSRHTRTALTSKFDFNTFRPTPAIGFKSPPPAPQSYPTWFSDPRQATTTTIIRSPTTDATPLTTSAHTIVEVSLSTAKRISLTNQSAPQTPITPQTTSVNPGDQSNLETERLTPTSLPVTTSTHEEKTRSNPGALITTPTPTGRENRTQTPIPPLTFTSHEATIQVSFSSTPLTSHSTTRSEPAKQTSSLSNTTPREAASYTSVTAKTTEVTTSTTSTTATTPPSSPAPSTTTTQTDRTTTTESTVATALELGDTCLGPYNTSGDPCTAWVPYSTCRDGRCRCVWPRYADSGTCVQYSLTNPDIQVSHVTETSITIMWSSQTFSGVQTVQYKVSWEVSGRSPDPGLPGSTTTSRTVHVIDKLTPGTVYKISVTAVLTDHTADPNRLDFYFNPALSRTAPSQVGIMTWTLSSDKNTVTLTFESPRGHFDHCLVVVHHMTLDGDTESSDPVLTFDCLTFNLSPFEVGIWYKVDVTVISGNIFGQLTTFNLTTPAAAPGLVTRPTWKTMVNSAQVTWRPPSQRHGYITGYELKLSTDGSCVKHVLLFVSSKQNQKNRYSPGWGPYEGGNSRQCDVSKVESLAQSGFDSLSYTFTDLRPGHQYSLELFAHNQNLKGEVTTVSLTTLSAIPNPPSQPRVGEVTSSSVLITWKPPEYPGPTNYTIQVYKSRLKEDVRFVRNMTVLGYTSTSIRVGDLQYNSRYWFNISAVTSAGESRSVLVGPGITLEKISDPVNRLKVMETTAHSVSLMWAHPKNVFGHLAAYIIFVRPESSPGKCQRVIILSEKEGFQVNHSVCSQGKVDYVHLMTLLHLTSIAFNVTDLQPYTNYVITVAAVNGAGLGRLSTVPVFTKISVPPTPRGQKCTYPSRGTINFSWDAPALTTGPTTYLIVVSKSKHFNDLSHGLEVFRNFTLPESSNRSLTLSGLEDFWLYSFSMSAHTAAGSSDLVTLAPPCRTSSASPGPIKDMHIVPVNTTSAQVLWQCPCDEDRHGTIGSFLISQRIQMFKNVDLDADSDLVETWTLDASPKTCSQTYSRSVRVKPEVTYVFQIQAKVMGIDQPGDLVSQVFTAPAAVPKPIVTLPTSKPYLNESSLKESTFSVSVCSSCLLDNSHGKVLAFGILVCQDGFCDQSVGDLHDWKSVYSGVATWKLAQSKQFETVYRATDRNWEQQLQIRQGSSNTNEVMFEVGNDTSCGNKSTNVYCNGPLPAGKSFRVRLFSCTTAGCSVSEPSGDLFMTAESDTHPSSDSVVIGGAVAGIAIVVVVLTVVIGVRLKFKDSKSKGGSTKAGSHEMTHIIVLPDVTNTVSSDTSRPIRLGDYDKMLRALHMNDNAAVSQEFVELNQKSPQHSVDVGSDLVYRHDNRWTNILPFDHSRVKLAVISGDEACAQDYINANYISGLESSRDYIATQGPLTGTVANFWRMIWEQNVSVVVMLSDFEELDKRTQIMREKVARYFPGDEETGPAQYGLIQVSRTRKDYNNKWEIRTLKLTHMRARKVRILKHFFFKHWSDHEADIDPRELIEFVELLRAEMKSLPRAPIVVHCSAGVGRTGTFIAVDYFYKLLSSMRPRSHTPGLGDAANKTVDIFGRILKLRDCRRFMVQSMSQYVFVYDAVQEIIQRVFQLQQSKNFDICDKEGHQSLDILSCQGSIEDTVYDDVDQLKGQVTADRNSQIRTA